MKLAALALVLACSGGKDDASAPAPDPVTLTWARSEADAFTRARAEHKGVLLHFYASWAVQSDELRRMLGEARVVTAMAPAFVPVEIDVSSDAEPAAEAQRRYGAQTIPAIVLVAGDGRVVGRVTQLGNVDELRVAIEQGARSLR